MIKDITYFTMNAKSSVLSLVSLRPTTILDIVQRLPYAQTTLYEAVEALINDGRLVRMRHDGRAAVAIPSGFSSQKLQQLYLKALSHGIDPQQLTRDGTIAVWRGLGSSQTVEGLAERTGLSPKWVRMVLGELEDWGLVTFEKRRPIVAKLVEDHPVNQVLADMYEEPETGEALLLPGSFPFTEELRTPRELERLLMDWMGGGLLVRDTDFQIMGKGGMLTVLDSVPRRPTLEETFLMMLTRTEGVEDICVRIVASGRLNHERLVELAVESGMVNVVGCYLEIVRDLGVTLGEEAIEVYRERTEDRVITFLEEERAYGKSGWEGPYEDRWGVDIYLDRGAIRHGVGSA
jgi:hypothetical protein